MAFADAVGVITSLFLFILHTFLPRARWMSVRHACSRIIICFISGRRAAHLLAIAAVRLPPSPGLRDGARRPASGPCSDPSDRRPCAADGLRWPALALRQHSAPGHQPGRDRAQPGRDRAETHSTETGWPRTMQRPTERRTRRAASSTGMGGRRGAAATCRDAAPPCERLPRGRSGWCAEPQREPGETRRRNPARRLAGIQVGFSRAVKWHRHATDRTG